MSRHGRQTQEKNRKRAKIRKRFRQQYGGRFAPPARWITESLKVSVLRSKLEALTD